MASENSGLDWMLGGGAAALLLPALALGLAMPFWIALSLSAGAGLGIAFLAAPKKPFAELDLSGAERGRIEFARDLLTAAEPEAGRLEAAAGAIRARPVAAKTRHLASIARDIFAAIERDPTRIDRVRRFLTYYLSRAADIAEAFSALERAPAPDPTRLAATSGLIDRLDVAFTSYAASLREADLDKLDIELKLLKSSLDEDIGPAAPVAGKQGKI